jgi:predicted transcriptional regulator
MGRDRFASVIGVGKRSLLKYEKGDLTLRESTKHRIEKSVRVIEKHNLVHPSPRHGFDSLTNMVYFQLNKADHDEYVEKFKSIYEKDEL